MMNEKSSSDAAQKSELVSQHKRMAMGVPLDGKSLSGGDKKPAPVNKTSK
jgi:hypothetical protein